MAVPAPTTSVLIVDDHVATRAGLKAILAAEPDVNVIGDTGSAEAAVTMAARRRPDVVIMDLQIDRSMAGFDATREILEQDPSIAVLLFTAFGERQLLTHGLECGARGFVVKDAPPEHLVDAVRRAHGGLRVVDPALAAQSLARGASPLTDRERDVLQAARGGGTVSDVAGALHLSEGTVRNHLSSAIGKTGARTRAEAAHIAEDCGWL